MTTGLERQLLAAICETCNAKDVDQDAMTADEPLLGPASRLGLDSLDGLEIVVMVQKRYGVRIESEQTSQAVLATLATLAKYIQAHREPPSAQGEGCHGMDDRGEEQ